MQSDIKLLIKSKFREFCFCVGAVGLTKDSTELLCWMICGPELSRCVNEQNKSRKNPVWLSSYEFSESYVKYGKSI